MRLVPLALPDGAPIFRADESFANVGDMELSAGGCGVEVGPPLGIAAGAQAWGQNDDITVVSVRRNSCG